MCNLYNGILKSKTCHDDNITPRDGYVVEWGIEEIDGVTYGTAYLGFEGNYIITDGDSTSRFTTLNSAVNAAESGQVVTLLRSLKDQSTVNINKNITLNIQEYILQRQSYTITVQSGKNFIIVGTGILRGLGTTTINNSGYLYISSNATVDNLLDEYTSNPRCIINNKSGTINMSSGTVKGVFFGIYNSGNVNITGGTVVGKDPFRGAAIYNTEGKIVITAGTVDGGAYRNSIYGED